MMPVITSPAMSAGCRYQRRAPPRAALGGQRGKLSDRASARREDLSADLGIDHQSKLTLGSSTA